MAWYSYFLMESKRQYFVFLLNFRNLNLISPLKKGYTFTFKTYLLIAFLSLLVFGSVYISPEWIWFAGFMSWTIPLVLLVQFIFCIYYIFLKTSFKVVFPLLMLALGWGHLRSTISFHAQHSPIENDNNFSVLSYNVRVFNTYDHLANENYASSKEMVQWIIDKNADVICLQEFYNDSHSKVFNTLNKISKSTHKQYFFSSSFTNRYGGDFGMTIFSKFPIIDKGVVAQDKISNNQMIYVDVKIGKEIVRVYNIHLQSMSIKEEDVVNAGVDERSKVKLLSVAKNLKRGFIGRSKQLKLLIDHIELSPYKVLLCGDLNDLPYGNTYMRLSKLLVNAFEMKGRGFGFTYNGKIPFLRIDNQFVDKSIAVNQFAVFRNVKYSDHFPIWANYTLNKKEE
jgi:endonuclease/exonuclease/phosphatase family metal-dependent hydrolase